MFQNEPHFADQTDHARYQHNITSDHRPSRSSLTSNEPKPALNNDLSEIFNDGSLSNTNPAGISSKLKEEFVTNTGAR